ncbi:MAG: methyltransferase type 11, partial [Flavobacteriales bacterium]
MKRQLGAVFDRTPFLRKTFYQLLDLLLLRCWHIQRELRSWIRQRISDGQPVTAIYDAGAGFGQYTYWLSGELPQA